MAQAAVELGPAQVNGVSPLSRPGSSQSMHSSTKRKRDDDDDDVSDDASHDDDAMDDDIDSKGTPLQNGDVPTRNEKALIRNFFEVLQSFDAQPTILKRRLSDDAADSEPPSKRAKSVEPTAASSIADKVSQDAYEQLDDLLLDIKRAVKSQVTELDDGDAERVTAAKKVEGIASTLHFEAKAHEIFRREMNYPRGTGDWQQPVKTESRDALPTASTGQQVLTVWGMGIRTLPYFSSVPHPTTSSDSAAVEAKPIEESKLPTGVTLTRLVSTPPGTEKAPRSLTLGELFPSPRNLPPLQPPRAAKATKASVLGFYHPVLTEKSKYRVNTYFSMNITAGHYLDYSNAAPSSQIKTKQRERAQSLAGHKPSSTELAMSETEALFRGAFSSFAPCKDDSAAMVSSGQVGRMWWHRVGQRALDRMIEAETSEDETDPVATGPAPGTAGDIDDELIEDALKTWDERAIDPSLAAAMGEKPQEEKDLDDILQDVSDGIETLASFQWNRNLALPTSQDRNSIDPVNGDMLRNASTDHPPSDEELMTYEALKAQLALIIKGLPPYAVARIDADKLAELNVSTKIAVRMDEYKGSVEDDEAARVRSQQQAAMHAAATSAPRPPQRMPSLPGGHYGTQYGGQYGGASRPPLPSPQAYPQSASRPPPPNLYQQRTPSSVPIPLPPQSQHRGPPGSAMYGGRPNGYGGYGSQLAKSQTPYGHTNLPQYAGSPPTQQRVAQQPHYTPHGHANSPGARFQPGYTPGQQHAPPQGQSPGFHANGTPNRTISPQVAAQQGHPYGQHTPTPQPHMNRPPPYGSRPPSYHQAMTPNSASGAGGGGGGGAAQRYYGPGGTGSGPAANSAAGGGGQSPAQAQAAARGLSGFATVMQQEEERQLVNQMKSRASAEEASRRFGEKIATTTTSGTPGAAPSPHAVSGLGGIGLGGSFDIAKLMAAKNRAAGSVSSSSPGEASRVQLLQQQLLQHQQQQQQQQQAVAAAASGAAVGSGTGGGASAAGMGQTVNGIVDGSGGTGGAGPAAPGSSASMISTASAVQAPTT